MEWREMYRESIAQISRGREIGVYDAGDKVVHEREAFKAVANMVSNAVSENEITSSIWAEADSHFKRLSDDQIRAVSMFQVGPKATESAGT